MEQDAPTPTPTNKGRGRPVRDRVVELVRVRAGDLQPNPRNWRRHPEPQRAALRGLLRQIGYADALLARREGDSLVLIDGHLRQSLDPAQVVPVLVLDVTEAEADTLLATLDPLAGLAQPDPEILADLLGRVDSSSRAVLDLLATVARDAGLPVRRVLADPEEVPSLPAEPRSKPGDLWILGEHRLLCGDATKEQDMGWLMGGEQAEAMWTDPPYGVDYVGKTPRALRITGDVPSGLTELLAGAFGQAGAVLRPGARIYVAHPAGPLSVVFLQAFLVQGWRLHQTLVWVKDSIVLGHGDYHYRHEPIAFGYVPGPGRWGRGAKGWYGGNDQSSVIEVARPAASREHPTTKPVELIRRCLVNSTKEGDRVLDPFCGSGSTLIACEVMGRAGYGMEIDPTYCDVAVARWEALTGRKATVEPNL
jgi:DNA modification methylase